MVAGIPGSRLAEADEADDEGALPPISHTEACEAAASIVGVVAPGAAPSIEVGHTHVPTTLPKDTPPIHLRLHERYVQLVASGGKAESMVSRMDEGDVKATLSEIVRHILRRVPTDVMSLTEHELVTYLMNDTESVSLRGVLSALFKEAERSMIHGTAINEAYGKEQE